MKLWKKILLGLLGLLIILQIPFIYRRFKIGGRAAQISELNAQRTNLSSPLFNEYKGVIHVHTNIGGHSTGTFDELLEAAAKTELDFVVMTEHTAPLYDTSALTLNGKYQNTLFVAGQEIETISGDRFLLVAGGPEVHRDAFLQTPQFLEKYHAQNRLALITYPEKFKTWDSAFDGIEVFSLHTNAKQSTPLYAPLDLVWSFPSYPELTFADYFRRPDANLQKFDELSRSRRVTLFAGTDAHSNIGFHLFGDDAGNKLVNIKLDRYETVFRLLRAHVLLEKDKPLTSENLSAAIKNGRLFVGFDVLGDTTGFSFSAENGRETRVMGDETVLTENLILKSLAPQKARFVLFKDGARHFEAKDTNELNFAVKEKGVYRIEVYLDVLGTNFEKMPWIISNPIYVR